MRVTIKEVAKLAGVSAFYHCVIQTNPALAMNKKKSPQGYERIRIITLISMHVLLAVTHKSLGLFYLMIQTLIKIRSSLLFLFRGIAQVAS